MSKYMVKNYNFHEFLPEISNFSDKNLYFLSEISKFQVTTLVFLLEISKFPIKTFIFFSKISVLFQRYRTFKKIDII